MRAQVHIVLALIYVLCHHFATSSLVLLAGSICIMETACIHGQSSGQNMKDPLLVCDESSQVPGYLINVVSQGVTNAAEQ